MIFGKEWTEAEDAVLRRIYPKYGSRVVLRELPHRSLNAIRQRAQALELARDYGYARTLGAWTAVEDDLIRQRYPKGGTAACLLVLPNRTVGAINQRARRLGVSNQAQHGDDTDVPVPQHDYTLSDYAVRNWRGPVEAGAFAPALGVQVAA